MELDEGRSAFWTVFATVAANLLAFIAVTSSASFQSLHHHWIFPTLAALLSAEWFFAGGLAPRARRLGFLDLPRTRATVLSILAFLILMGVVRHWSILTCFGRCSLKLGSAAALAGAIFLLQSRAAGAAPLPAVLGGMSDGPMGPPSAGEPHLWGRERSRTAGLGCLLWAAYLLLYGLKVPGPVRDGAFLAAAAACLADVGGRRLRLVGAGVALGLLIRWTCPEIPAIILGLALALGALYAAGRPTVPAGTP